MKRRFLHFSDIHFGQEKNGTLEIHEDVRFEVLSDCRTVLNNGLVDGPIDAILLTGDIAQQGKEAEFKRAVDWLDALTTIVKCDRTNVRVIPGNHDVDLDLLGQSGKTVQDALRAMEVDKIPAYMSELAADENNALIGKFKDYRSFASAYGSDFQSIAHPMMVHHYDVPEGKALRLIGMCSVMVSDKTDDKGRMILGRSQYVIPRDDRYEDVYMMHHPLDWFKDKKQAQNYVNSRARILMTGHEHSPDLSVLHHEGDWQQLHIAAGALNPPHETADHTYTYNWIEFHWSNEQGRAILNVTVYPRIWTKTTRFGPDKARTGGFDYQLLKLDCGPAPVKPASADSVAPAKQETAPTPESQAIEVVDMSETNPVPPKVKDPHAFDLLRFLFWRHLDRELRQQILVEMNLLPPSNRPLPDSFERQALELASQQDKLPALWDAIMPHVPSDQRQPNPFNKT